MSMDYGKVAVLMGGVSAEREISLASGHAVLSALVRNGIDACGLDAGVPFLAHLDSDGYARAFIALHGPMGEDGAVQGGLEVLGLPYTGSGVLACALAMDKPQAKRIWRSLGLPTPDWMEIRRPEDLDEAAGRLRMPLAIKPVGQGSSYGVTCVEKRGALRDAWQRARQYGTRVMAERWVDGMELTVAILEDARLPPVCVRTPRRFYDYQAKYASGQTEYLCPCGLPKKRTEALQNLALRAFEALGGRGWGRIDMVLARDGTPALLELNTVPGLTDHSLVPLAARRAGIEFPELVLRILAGSRCETARIPAAPGIALAGGA